MIVTVFRPRLFSGAKDVVHGRVRQRKAEAK